MNSDRITHDNTFISITLCCFLAPMGAGTAHHYGALELYPQCFAGFLLIDRYVSVFYSQLCVTFVCLLTIVLSGHQRTTTFDYPFGIFKDFLSEILFTFEPQRWWTTPNVYVLHWKHDLTPSRQLTPNNCFSLSSVRRTIKSLRADTFFVYSRHKNRKVETEIWCFLLINYLHCLYIFFIK